MSDNEAIYQPRDANGNFVIEGARISYYLGRSAGVDRYVLEVPEQTAHQTGPYTMTKEKKR